MPKKLLEFLKTEHTATLYSLGVIFSKINPDFDSTSLNAQIEKLVAAEDPSAQKMYMLSIIDIAIQTTTRSMKDCESTTRDRNKKVVAFCNKHSEAMQYISVDGVLERYMIALYNFSITATLSYFPFVGIELYKHNAIYLAERDDTENIMMALNFAECILAMNLLKKVIPILNATQESVDNSALLHQFSKWLEDIDDCFRPKQKQNITSLFFSFFSIPYKSADTENVESTELSTYRLKF